MTRTGYQWYSNNNHPSVAKRYRVFLIRARPHVSDQKPSVSDTVCLLQIHIILFYPLPLTPMPLTPTLACQRADEPCTPCTIRLPAKRSFLTTANTRLHTTNLKLSSCHRIPVRATRGSQGSHRLSLFSPVCSFRCLDAASLPFIFTSQHFTSRFIFGCKP